MTTDQEFNLIIATDTDLILQDCESVSDYQNKRKKAISELLACEEMRELIINEMVDNKIDLQQAMLNILKWC